MLIISFGIIFLFPFFWNALSYKREPWLSGWKDKHMQSKIYIDRNIDSMKIMITDVFDKTSECAVTRRNTQICEKQNKERIEALFKDQAVFDFPSTYFIRISEYGTIEKLFLSGAYFDHRIKRKGDRQVSLFLQEEQEQDHLLCIGGFTRW